MQVDDMQADDTDTAARPDRDGWARLRGQQGRATPEDWRETPVLLAYQAQIARACETHDVVFVEKSRRTGATWGAAADAVLRSASPRGQGGMDTLYMGTSHDMAKEFIDAAAMWARLFEKAAGGISQTLFDDGSDKGIQALKIDFASGFSIVALSSKPRSLRGRQGFAILDEAAFVDNLAELLKAAMAFLIWGGKVLVISTHNGADNPFNQVITDIRAGRLRYGLVRFDLDDALRQGLYERICLVNPKTGGGWSAGREADWREKLIDDYGAAGDEELYCIPSSGSGVFLPGPLIEARMFDAPVLRIAVPEGFTHLPAARRQAEVEAWIDDNLRPAMLAGLDRLLTSALGMDVGRYRDLSVIAPIQVGRTMRRVVPFIVEMERLPFEQQRQIAVAIWEAMPRRIGFKIDATGLGAGIAEDLQLGHGAEPVRISTEWYRTVLPPLKAAFEDDMIAIPRDAEIHADLRALKMVKGVAVLPALRKASAAGGTRHGDAAIALALAYDATRTGRGDYAYQPVAVPGQALRREPDWRRSSSDMDDADVDDPMTPRLRGGL
jgi:phage FluMu gp28-like protein